MNNLTELKAILLNIHEKDKQQIIHALITVEVCIIPVSGLIAYSIFVGKSHETPMEVLFILLLLPIMVLVPYLFMLIQVKRRPRKISDFVYRLERGETVHNIDTYTDYKLMLPFRIIRLRLFPMEYGHVCMGNGRAMYKLPLSAENVQSFKSLVSQPFTKGVVSLGSSANWSSN
ncbi:hypothetical protein ACDQ55_11015 [Chitinophaga sp. 30R24]|uniref:hypothetical protein n=1 Tax=Chitinophaga sp. 30R24 TaxID=3248838 RepID=UPI003B8F18BA